MLGPNLLTLESRLTKNWRPLSPVFFRCERAPLGKPEIRTQLSADPGARPGSMMRVVCDNCGAVYKISESKLVKEVNRATCQRCGHKIRGFGLVRE